MRLLAAFLLPVFCCAAATTADIERGVRETDLDPAECYRVHDLHINKDDIHLYFTDGYLIFGKPVDGIRTAAVFTADVEAGDAELLLLPPDRSERKSLADYTGSPNLDEHLNTAVLLFGDRSYDELMRQIHASEFNRRSLEMGALMADQWSPIVRNLSASFATRLLLDLLSSRPPQGCFIAAVTGKKLGNFDVIYEPRAPEQILVGQLNSRNSATFFDVWTSFAAAPYRNGLRKTPAPELSIKDYRIDATLEADLLLRVVTKAKVKLEEGGRVLPFYITGRMEISSASIDGEPVEVLEPESLRANLIRNDGNNLFLLVAPHALAASRDYEVEFHHEGRVVEDAGNKVYYVGSRGTWYPNFGTEFARYDLTFRYPKGLDLVTPGGVTSDTTEGEWRITRRVTEVPIRFAGFNLGVYKRTQVARNGYTVEVCANRAVEATLQPKPHSTDMTSQARVSRRAEILKVPPPQPDPPARLEDLASQVVSALEFMSARFGPPPLQTLEVSPIPGAFGQGFPGLLYLSTLAYLRREDAVLARLDARGQTFFMDLLQAHETAHQWWGNVVSTEGYRDGWLMEALANYSALLYLENRDGKSALDAALDNYRRELLAKSDNGHTIESAGPIVLGERLESSQSPAAWNRITYGKGAWIMHMLRSLMGQERFVAMLGELRRRYEWKTISTDEFRRLAAEFLPPKSPDPKLEAFFEQWVYSTGVPTLKLSYAVHGRPPAVKLAGSVQQSDVDSEFTVQVPVEIESGRTRRVEWVTTSNSPADFTVALKDAPTRITLDTSSVLAVSK